MHQNLYNQRPKRWGTEQQQVGLTDLLTKKDMQIKRLQAQLQVQKNRADHAMKMLESFKNIKQQSQESNQGLRSQVNRRIKAQQQVKRLKKRNDDLQNGMKQYMKELQYKLKDVYQYKSKYQIPQEYFNK